MPADLKPDGQLQFQPKPISKMDQPHSLSKAAYWLLLTSFLFYGLHLTRNVNSLVPLVGPLLSFVVVAYVYIIRRPLFARIGLAIIVFYMLATLESVVISYIWYDERYAESILRFYYIMPLVLASAILTFRVQWIGGFLNTYVFIVILGCISIFYQYFFGPIWWFADSSERDGLVRYSSLLGSLTVLGIAGGIALPIIWFQPKSAFVKAVLLGVVCLAMLYSLQKAAVMNILIFLCIIGYELIRERRLALLCCLLVLAASVVAFALFLDLGYVSSTIRNVARIGGEINYSDVSVLESVSDRIWGLPSVLFDMHGARALIFGVGMTGASGSLGFSEYPMAHNVYFDFIFVGGAIYLVLFLVLFFRSWARFHQLMHSAEPEHRLIFRAAFFAQLVIFANLPFASGMQYQPVIGGFMMSIALVGALFPTAVRNG